MKLAILFMLILDFCLRSNAIAASFTASTYASISSSAAGPAVETPPGYRLQSFVACQSAVVIDAPSLIGESILRAIRSVTSLPVSHVIYSHAHADHIGGAYLFGSPSNVSFVAHQETAEELVLSPDYEHRPAPTITFDEGSYNLQVCNQSLQLEYNGPNYEPGNISIHAPVQRILMLVDVVYPGWIPFNALGESQNRPGWIKGHDQILTYDFDHYVGGHLDRAGTRLDVLIQREYVHDLYNWCAEALLLSAQPANSSNSLSASVILSAVEKIDPGNLWASFRTCLDTVANYVANVTVDKWSNRLAGTDVSALSNAEIMLESVRIDARILGPFGVTN